MDAIGFFLERYGHLEAGLGRLDDLDEGRWRARPHGLNSIAWLVWHMARAEDAGVNRIGAEQPQVLDEQNWLGRLGIERRDAGRGMASAEVDALSERIDVEALRAYWRAVTARTRQVVGGLAPEDLDTLVPGARFL